LQWEGIVFRAVEVDAEKVEYLLQAYPALREKLLHQDFLKIEPPFEGPFTVTGNFPYNISTEILFRMIEWKEQVTCMVGMFQKEVALRVAALPGSKIYGVTSVLVQAHYQVDYLFDVSEQCFQPPPKVKSGVIRLLRRSDEVPVRSDVHLTRLVKTAFMQRRKTLRNAVSSLFPAAELADPIFQQRAEQLSVADFASLTFRMK
jgi:16S rRNA (adenine1518-N6/adenine1519-N6)-dimethyltransferase